ncbi:MAG: flagellar hook-associated protein FlgK [Myxococcales bacterium]|nr:MAG: flagellar hook-associated protein FlgK [Myxococcales bacterium]
MGSLNQLLYTARDSLSAQSYGLNVTGQNITNVNTPGYVRRDPLLETRALGTATTGTVTANGLRRATDVYIERRELTARGSASAASEHDKQLGSVEALFNDLGATGMGSVLDGLYSSFSALAANPNDPTVRSSVLGAADAFASRANSIGNSLSDQKNELFKAAQDTASQINQAGESISVLNRRILAAEAQGEDAADLKDQRNNLLLGLSELVDVRTISDVKGSIVVQVSGGTLVDGVDARKLDIGLQDDGSLKLTIARDGDTPTEVTKFLTGGRLAGIKDARDVDLFDVSERFDKLVFDVASSVNAQHAAGFGKDGVTGRDLFDVPAVALGSGRAVRLSAGVAGNPDAIAAASDTISLPGGTGNAVALANLWSQPISGGRTAAETYGDIVGGIGQRKAAIAQAVETQSAIKDQVQAMRESVSGVSLDEEMVALTKYQRAYEAAGKVLSVADELLADLINRVGR